VSVNCPYCKAEQEINHGGGYGLDEDKYYECKCTSCGEVFSFESFVSVTYNVYCVDGKHEMEPLGGIYSDTWKCKNCEHYERREA